MIKDINSINIWKAKECSDNANETFLSADINELNLGVRSFNCLKRAGCNTIQDIINCIGEDGQGLRKLRNLGSRSESEIMEKLQEYKELCVELGKASSTKKVTLIKPARKVWDQRIEEFHLSNFAAGKLKACGIDTVGDLYATNPKKEPGWYAVRELFEKIPTQNRSC